MRKIKFRYWNTKFKRFEHGTQCMVGENGFSQPPDLIPMQFTGLLDKNGKESYFGDLFLIDNEVVELSWDELNTGLVWRRKQLNPLEPPRRDDNMVYIGFEPKDITENEIIGNKYENKDLLK